MNNVLTRFEEDEEQSVDEEDIFYRMVFSSAITRGLFSRVLEADDPSFRPVIGKRGASRVAETSAGSAADELTTEAAWASETRAAGRGPSGTGGHRRGSAGRQHCGQEDVDPLVRFALAHAEQAALHRLEAVGFRSVSRKNRRPSGSVGGSSDTR